MTVGDSQKEELGNEIKTLTSQGDIFQAPWRELGAPSLLTIVNKCSPGSPGGARSGDDASSIVFIAVLLADSRSVWHVLLEVTPCQSCRPRYPPPFFWLLGTYKGEKRESVGRGEKTKEANKEEEQKTGFSFKRKKRRERKDTE